MMTEEVVQIVTTKVVDHTTELEGLTTTSSKIRKLLSLGYKRGDVAKILDIRYQHVRNVELMPIKKQK